MSKPLRKQQRRLQRRQNSFEPDPKNRLARRLPGSMNPRKCEPLSVGHRSRSAIQGDSRKATAH